MNEEHKKILKKCRDQSPTCFDCGSKNPAWGSIHFGILVCFDCAGSHRQMGTHISFVRSTAFDGWSDAHIKKMIVGGNSRARQYFRKYGMKPGQKTKCFTDYYDSKVARRYKELIAEDAKKHVLVGSPKSPQDVKGIDKLISGLQLSAGTAAPSPPMLIARTVPIVTPTPVPVSKPVVTKKAVVTKQKTVKKANAFAKKAAAKKPTKSLKLGQKKAKAGFLADEDSSDFDAASSEEEQKPVKKSPKEAKSPFGQTQKQQPSQSGGASEVRRVFQNKYGTKLRGGEKKMTSIGSDDFFNNDPGLDARKQQFTGAQAIGSDAYFGREDPSAQKKGAAPGDLNWDDIRSEASDKMSNLSQAANSWFSSLTDKLQR